MSQRTINAIIFVLFICMVFLLLVDKKKDRPVRERRNRPERADRPSRADRPERPDRPDRPSKNKLTSVKDSVRTLAICKKIVEKHGGSLALNTSTPHTIFKILLPNG